MSLFDILSPYSSIVVSEKYCTQQVLQIIVTLLNDSDNCLCNLLRAIHSLVDTNVRRQTQSQAFMSQHKIASVLCSNLLFVLDLIVIDNDDRLSFDFASVDELGQILYLVKAVERIRLNLDTMFSYAFQHALTLFW